MLTKTNRNWNRNIWWSLVNFCNEIKLIQTNHPKFRFQVYKGHKLDTHSTFTIHVYITKIKSLFGTHFWSQIEIVPYWNGFKVIFVIVFPFFFCPPPLVFTLYLFCYHHVCIANKATNVTVQYCIQYSFFNEKALSKLNGNTENLNEIHIIYVQWWVGKQREAFKFT